MKPPVLAAGVLIWIAAVVVAAKLLKLQGLDFWIMVGGLALLRRFGGSPERKSIAIPLNLSMKRTNWKRFAAKPKLTSRSQASVPTQSSPRFPYFLSWESVAAPKPPSF
jgi:hypothetical protein